MTWQNVGTVNVGPQDREVLVGSFSMEPEQDVIWFRITQTNPVTPWNFSYGLLTWRTSFGQELGTTKVFGSLDGECYGLGIGLPPLERTGGVYFTPRSYNREWISISDPPIWELSIEAQAGKSSVGPPAFGYSSTLTTFADLVGNTVEFAIKDSFARLVLTP